MADQLLKQIRKHAKQLRFKPIYILRSECVVCGRDTQRIFLLKGRELPARAYQQMEYWVTRRWPVEYGCTHPIKFTHITEDKYHYSVRLRKAVLK